MCPRTPRTPVPPGCRGRIHVGGSTPTSSPGPSSPPTPTAAAVQTPDVIMDLEVDGLRCRITRLPRKPAPSRVLLSPREREIARRVAKGYPNKTIAGVLEISCWTVGTYLRRIFAKLNVCSRAAMVARILEDGPLEKSLGPL